MKKYMPYVAIAIGTLLLVLLARLFVRWMAEKPFEEWSDQLIRSVAFFPLATSHCFYYYYWKKRKNQK